MTSHERFKRVFEHKLPDRVPVMDYPWNATIERWNREGLPKSIDYIEYFNLDRYARIFFDVSPQFEKEAIEETEEYIIETTEWGATVKNWKHSASVPEFVDFQINTPEEWEKIKERIVPSKSRIDWSFLKENYAKWRQKGYWIEARLWFGFDVSHSWIVGTERFLIALLMQPEWVDDMFSTMLDMNLQLLQMLWDAGYEFDSIGWCDDMGYKNNQFFSVDTYKEILKPYHQKAVQWAHSHGVNTHLHSCGDIRPFIPELINIGVDALNPLEVKAGIDPLEIKNKFGSKLVLHGGVNALLFDDFGSLYQTVNKILPQLKQDGGYIFASDHSIPSSISFEDFGKLIELIKRVGSYE